MKSITVNISGKCTAKCSHCCFSCSPSNTTCLSEDEIWKVVDYGIKCDDISEISISGGEPFLYEDLIFDIIKKVSSSGKTPTCITNAFWAKDPDSTSRKLRQLNDAGLKYLTVSYDDFHANYIPTDYIKNIITASFQTKMRISINMAVTKQDDGIMLLKELKDCLLGIPITRFSVMPIGSAQNINEKEMYSVLDLNKPLRCSEPSYSMVVHHNSLVYPCCSPAVFETVLSIGSIRDYSLDKLRSKLYKNLIIFIIKKEGPGWFLNELHKKGIDSFDKQYISTCHLCYSLFKDGQVIEILKDEIELYNKKEILKI